MKTLFHKAWPVPFTLPHDLVKGYKDGNSNNNHLSNLSEVFICSFEWQRTQMTSWKIPVHTTQCWISWPHLISWRSHTGIQSRDSHEDVISYRHLKLKIFLVIGSVHLKPGHYGKATLPFNQVSNSLEVERWRTSSIWIAEKCIILRPSPGTF